MTPGPISTAPGPWPPPKPGRDRITEAFLKTHCAPVVQGVDRIGRWVKHGRALTVPITSSAATSAKPSVRKKAAG